ncbi:hypothetical protein [Xanthobacter versatilis]|uniref:hypothetical protein n=1 Tax=Xanthobacter autotrophicus (strain ATCC BAA-1158 / Py2) TaxID=78245 RepID=UPI00372ADEC5
MQRDLPHVPSPPLAPELPREPADAARAPALEVNATSAEAVMAVPVALLQGFSANADALAYLMEQPVVAAVVEALGAQPADVASAARAMSALAGDALGGRWQGPTAEAARHAEVAHLTRARRHRPRPAARPARPFAPTVHLLTADEIRATAASARAMAKEVANPERAAALRAAGVRVDQLQGLEVHAGRLEACADEIAQRMTEAEDMRRHLQSMGLGVRTPGADDTPPTA